MEPLAQKDSGDNLGMLKLVVVRMHTPVSGDRITYGVSPSSTWESLLESGLT
jgi:hypothetical protein